MPLRIWMPSWAAGPVSATDCPSRILVRGDAVLRRRRRGAAPATPPARSLARIAIASCHPPMSLPCSCRHLEKCRILRQLRGTSSSFHCPPSWSAYSAFTQGAPRPPAVAPAQVLRRRAGRAAVHQQGAAQAESLAEQQQARLLARAPPPRRRETPENPPRRRACRGCWRRRETTAWSAAPGVIAGTGITSPASVRSTSQASAPACTPSLRRRAAAAAPLQALRQFALVVAQRRAGRHQPSAVILASSSAWLTGLTM